MCIYKSLLINLFLTFIFLIVLVVLFVFLGLGYIARCERFVTHCVLLHKLDGAQKIILEGLLKHKTYCFANKLDEYFWKPYLNYDKKLLQEAKENSIKVCKMAKIPDWKIKVASS